MELMINEKGQLVDAEGNLVKIGDEDVTIKDAMTKSQTENAIKERLSRQKDQIKNLEKAAEKTPELERMLENLRKEKEETERQLSEAEKEAEKKVQTQIQTLKQQNEQFKQNLEAERKGRMQDRLSREILENSGDVFISPGQDVVPRLLQVHKQENKIGEDGKAVNDQFIDLFEVDVVGEDDKVERKALPLKEAIQAFAKNPANSHYVKADFRKGTGPSNKQNTIDFNKVSSRKDLGSSSAKSAYIKEHGLDAYKALPSGDEK